MSDGCLTALLHAEGIKPHAVYRTAEVCKLLRVSRSTLLRWCEEGALPFMRMGAQYRFQHAALADWLVRVEGDCASVK